MDSHHFGSALCARAPACHHKHVDNPTLGGSDRSSDTPQPVAAVDDADAMTLRPGDASLLIESLDSPQSALPEP
eukprot:3585830-Rhodomonas_salina.1